MLPSMDRKQRRKDALTLRHLSSDERRTWPNKLVMSVGFWADALTLQERRLADREFPDWNAPYVEDIDLLFLVNATRKLMLLVTLAKDTIGNCGLPTDVADQVRADLRTRLEGSRRRSARDRAIHPHGVLTHPSRVLRHGFSLDRDRARHRLGSRSVTGTPWFVMLLLAR